MFIFNNGSVNNITEALQKTFMLKQQNSFLIESLSLDWASSRMVGNQSMT